MRLEGNWERLGANTYHTPTFTYKASTKVSSSNIQSLLIKQNLSLSM